MKNHYFDSVYDVVALIPVGNVTTYGAIANFLGLGSARMVGWALNHSANTGRTIPAHRVVNRKGELSGRLHFGESAAMAALLKAEGIDIEDDVVVNFKEFFWDPVILQS